jgi:hypothetical protein
MLYFMVCWASLLVICTVIGGGVLDVIRCRVLTRLGDRWMVAIWLGILALSLCFLSASFFLPLSPWLGIAIAALLCGFAGCRLGTRQLLGAVRARVTGRRLLLTLLLMILIALPMTQSVVWYDTGLYHFGVIRWLANYGTVPGLSLLVSQFGFFATWFALAAPFNPEELGTRGTVLINGFVTFVGVAHLSLAIARLAQSRGQLSDWFLLHFGLMALGFISISSFMREVFISPSTDIPILLLTALFAWLLVIFFQAKITPKSIAQPRFWDDRIVLLLFGAGAVAIKLTALPILPVAWLAYSVVRGKLNLQRACFGLGVIALVLLPAMVYGLLTSGCPIYPSQALCLDLPWSARPEQMVMELARVTDWMDWFGEPPAGVVPWQWALKQWFVTTASNVAIVGLAVLAMVGVAILWRKYPLRRLDDQAWIVLLGFLGMAFTLTRTPVVRLGLGYFLILPAFFGALFWGGALGDRILRFLGDRLTSAGSWGQRHASPLVFVGTLLVILGIAVQPGLAQRWLLPPPLPTVASGVEQINDLDYRYPLDAEVCWAIALPCIQEGMSDQKGAVLEENLVLRAPDAGLAGGFMLRDRIVPAMEASPMP